jgi:NADPH:quinone reductase-like Zn-dependent oxidoreductase
MLAQSLFVGPVASLATGKSMGLMLWWKPFHPDDVTSLGALHAAGKLRPVIDRRYGLDEIVEALRFVDEGGATGKVIVTMGTPDSSGPVQAAP